MDVQLLGFHKADYGGNEEKSWVFRSYRWSNCLHGGTSTAPSCRSGGWERSPGPGMRMVSFRCVLYLQWVW